MLRRYPKQQQQPKQPIKIKKRTASAKPDRVVATSYLDLERPKSLCAKSFRRALLTAVGCSDAINNNNNCSYSLDYYYCPNLVVNCEHCGRLGVELTTCHYCGRYLPMPAAATAATKSQANGNMISATSKRKTTASSAPAAAAAAAPTPPVSNAAGSNNNPVSNSTVAPGNTVAPQRQQSQQLRPPKSWLSGASSSNSLPNCLQTGAALSADIQRFLASRSAASRVSATASAASAASNAVGSTARQSFAPGLSIAALQRHPSPGKTPIRGQTFAAPVAATSTASVASASSAVALPFSFNSKRPRLETRALTAPPPQPPAAVAVAAVPIRPSLGSSSQSLLGSPIVEMPLDQVCIGGSTFQKVDPPHNLLKVYRGFTQFSFPRVINGAKARRRRLQRRRRRRRRNNFGGFEDDEDEDFDVEDADEDEDFDADLADDDVTDSDEDEEEEEVDYAQIHLHHNQINKVSFANEPTCFVAFRLRSADFSRRICSEAGLQPDALSAAESRELGKKWIVLVSDNERDEELRKLFAFYTDKKAECHSKFDFDLQNLNKVSARGMLDHCQEGFFNELLGLSGPTHPLPTPPPPPPPPLQAPPQSSAAPTSTISSLALRLHSTPISCAAPASSSAAAANSAAAAEIYQKVVNTNLAIGRLVQKQQKQQQQQQQHVSAGNGTAAQQLETSPMESAPFQSDFSQEQQQQQQAQRLQVSTASASSAATADSSANKPAPRLTGQVIEKFSYSPGGSNGITITNADLMCLNPCEYLNDVAIDFYLKYMYHEMLTPEQRKTTHIFNCFFFKRLSQKLDPPPGKDESAASLAIRRHETVAKWTRKVDLFAKDFILIPINENCHWFLAVICFPWMVGMVNYSGSAEASVSEKLVFDVRMAGDGTLRMPCVLMFDSLMGSTRSPNVLAIREYLQVEWDTKKKSMKGPKVFDKETIRGYCPCVPLQPNTVDCGPYVLHYAELFFKRPVREFTRSYFQSEMSGWFLQEEINHKRADIQDLIVSLAGKSGALGPDAASAIAAAANSDSALRSAAGSNNSSSASSSFCT